MMRTRDPVYTLITGLFAVAFWLLMLLGLTGLVSFVSPLLAEVMAGRYADALFSLVCMLLLTMLTGFMGRTAVEATSAAWRGHP